MKEYASPAMHTAEHILNQTMVRRFHRGRSFSSHIERKKSKCDYRFDRDLTPAERLEIEQAVNAVIAADLPVREEHMPREEAAGLFDLGRLPESAGQVLRIIRIGDYDACPCGGEHVTATGAIGGFSIVSTEHKEGVLRIRFKVDRPDGQ
jgi:misacylated tRNA(Ala) deacylase